MKKQFLHTLVALVVLSSWSIDPARADLTMEPLSTWEITGDFGDVLSLNGIPAGGLITGTSTFAVPPGPSTDEPAEAADDFSLRTTACADGEEYVQTIFPQAVHIIFMLEKSGNDSGTIQGLDSDGSDIGNSVAFVGNPAGPWTSTGYRAMLGHSPQIAWGTVITSDIPIYGIRIEAPGIDPVSIMAVPVYPARNPRPSDGSVVPDISILLQWDPGLYAADLNGHHVYFGNNWDDVNDGTGGTDMGLTSSTSYLVSDLARYKTYYWRVDEVNDLHPDKLWPGPVWSFFVPPLTAYSPSPLDGVKFADPDGTLSWKAGSGAVKGHVVIFGDSFSEVHNAPTGITGSSPPYRVYLTDVDDTDCTPVETGHPPLEADTSYYWRIDEIESLGPPVVAHKGAVWSFTTAPYIPITDPDLVGWWKFDEGEGAIAVDWSGHSNHGTLQGATQWTTGYHDNAVYLSGQLPGQRGTNDYVGLPTGLVDSKTGSIGAWIKTTEIWTCMIFYGTDDPNTTNDGFGPANELHLNMNDQYSPYYANAGVIGFSITGSPNVQLTGSAVDDDTWHHVAATWDKVANVVNLYLDSVLIASADYTGNDFNLSGRIRLGRPNADVRYYSGSLDDVRLYNRALSAAQIRKLIALPQAWRPIPADNATDVRRTLAALTWEPGRHVADVGGHKVYFSSDFSDVNDRTIAPVILSDPCYPISAPLDLGETYYWRVDEVNGVDMWPGDLWRFTVGDYITVDDFEDYTDFSPDRIFDTWVDYYTNNSGATVGYLQPAAGEHFVETTIVHGGTQSMPLFYDNDGTVNEGTTYEKTGTYYYSEAERTFDTPQDWTQEAVAALTIWFHGIRDSVGGVTYDSATSTYTMTASGEDIGNIIDPRWTTYHDEFHFAYKQLSGEGSIIAKIESLNNTDPLAKAGVMIRETLEADSPYAMVALTPTEGVVFQSRGEKGGLTIISQQVDVNAPHWVRISRQQNTFTGDHSDDGVNWVGVQGEHPSSATIYMSANSYIGLVLTAHHPVAIASAVFSNVGTGGSGTVSPAGPFTQSQDIGILSNDPGRLYVIVEDNTGSFKLVEHPDPNGTQLDSWQEWNIDMQDFSDAGVNLAAVQKMSIGVGDKAATSPAGSGTVYFDDIRLYRPRCVPDELTLPKADRCDLWSAYVFRNTSVRGDSPHDRTGRARGPSPVR